jgi:hypothetical protein
MTYSIWGAWSSVFHILFTSYAEHKIELYSRKWLIMNARLEGGWFFTVFSGTDGEQHCIKQ